MIGWLVSTVAEKAMAGEGWDELSGFVRVYFI